MRDRFPQFTTKKGVGFRQARLPIHQMAMIEGVKRMCEEYGIPVCWFLSCVENTPSQRWCRGFACCMKAVFSDGPFYVAIIMVHTIILQKYPCISWGTRYTLDGLSKTWSLGSQEKRVVWQQCNGSLHPACSADVLATENESKDKMEDTKDIES